MGPAPRKKGSTSPPVYRRAPPVLDCDPMSPSLPTVGHWIDGQNVSGDHHSQDVFNPATGAAERRVLLADRATVAAANDRLSRLIDGVPSTELREGRIMRVQETFNPTGSTIAASSDLATVKEIEELSDVLNLIMPPEKGHAPAHDARVIAIAREIISDEVVADGPMPVASVEVHGLRAGTVRRRPVAVASEHVDTLTSTASRWASLEGRFAHAAFRKPVDPAVKRGLAAIYYHLSDSAKLRLEAPYAMTSHRAQGSTFPHVMVLADSVKGGRVVDHRVASARDASAYVMLSRASQSLTIAWKPRLILSGSGSTSGIFNF